jgi:hypothetical protein
VQTLVYENDSHMSIDSRSSIALALAFVCAIGASTAFGSSAFSVSALIDSIHPGNRGDSIFVRSDTREIRSLTVTYTHGVRGRLPQLDTATRAIAFTLLTGPTSGTRVTGYLRLRPDLGGTMTSSEVPSLRASYRGGREPRLRVTGLPYETHQVEIATIGRARGLLRKVARCTRHQQRDTNVMRVVFADGTRSKTNRNTVSCGF